MPRSSAQLSPAFAAYASIIEQHLALLPASPGPAVAVAQAWHRYADNANLASGALVAAATVPPHDWQAPSRTVFDTAAAEVADVLGSAATTATTIAAQISYVGRRLAAARAAIVETLLTFVQRARAAEHEVNLFALSTMEAARWRTAHARRHGEPACRDSAAHLARAGRDLDIAAQQLSHLGSPATSLLELHPVLAARLRDSSHASGEMNVAPLLLGLPFRTLKTAAEKLFSDRPQPWPTALRSGLERLPARVLGDPTLWMTMANSDLQIFMNPDLNLLVNSSLVGAGGAGVNSAAARIAQAYPLIAHANRRFWADRHGLRFDTDPRIGTRPLNLATSVSNRTVAAIPFIVSGVNRGLDLLGLGQTPPEGDAAFLSNAVVRSLGVAGGVGAITGLDKKNPRAGFIAFVAVGPQQFASHVALQPPPHHPGPVYQTLRAPVQGGVDLASTLGDLHASSRVVDGPAVHAVRAASNSAHALLIVTVDAVTRAMDPVVHLRHLDDASAVPLLSADGAANAREAWTRATTAWRDATHDTGHGPVNKATTMVLNAAQAAVHTAIADTHTALPALDTKTAASLAAEHRDRAAAAWRRATNP